MSNARQPQPMHCAQHSLLSTGCGVCKSSFSPMHQLWTSQWVATLPIKQPSAGASSSCAQHCSPLVQIHCPMTSPHQTNYHTRLTLYTILGKDQSSLIEVRIHIHCKHLRMNNQPLPVPVSVTTAKDVGPVSASKSRALYCTCTCISV